MPYGLTSMRDPRNKVNDRQDRTGLMDPENRLTFVGGRGAGGWVGKGEGLGSTGGQEQHSHVTGREAQHGGCGR